jgi:Phage major capsid protein E
MINTTYDTVELLEVIEDTKKPSRFFLDNVFTDVVRFNTKKISVDQIIEDQRVAGYVQSRLAAPVRDERGFESKFYEAPYVKERSEIDPEAAFERGPGEALGGERSPQDRYDDSIAMLTQKHEDRITRAEELQGIQLCREGVVTIKGVGFDHTIPMLRDPSQTFALAGGLKWDQTTSDPLRDFSAWSHASMRLPYGSPIRKYIFDPLAGDKLLWRVRARGELDMINTQNRGTNGQIELGPHAEQSYKLGEVNGIELWVHQAQYENEAGSVVNMMGDHTVIGIGASAGGVLAYGAIRIGGVLRAVTRYPRIVGGPNQEPATEHLVTEASPLTMFRRINGTLCATVA